MQLLLECLRALRSYPSARVGILLFSSRITLSLLQWHPSFVKVYLSLEYVICTQLCSQNLVDPPPERDKLHEITLRGSTGITAVIF